MSSQTAQHPQGNLRQLSHLAVPFKGMGHVFLLRGDLRSLQCDAIGYSGDVHSQLSSTWRKALEEAGGGSWTEEVSWPVDDRRWVRRLSGAVGEPKPYVVPVAGTATHEVGWYLDALRVFLLQATEDHKQAGKVPKLAIPLLGGGRGGKGKVQGELLQKTLEFLWDFTRNNTTDVAVVFPGDEGFDAAQWYRRRHGAEAWSSLADPLCKKADRLASLAVRGDLALFLGAGVSVGAGLPSWWKLLNELGEGHLSKKQIKEAQKLQTVDYAQLLARHVTEDRLKQLVLERIKTYRRCSFAHALLAALPVKEIATTNYDNLFEIAAEKAGRKAHVIPYKGALSKDVRWLLKLHGSVENPKDVVLSRKTFLQYEASRAALAGLFAGVLLTRHVVFVGSSFTDDNILRITEEAQRIGRPGTSRPRLGTCLAVGIPSVQKALWEGEFDWVDFGSKAIPAGRMLEIFLDRVLAGTVSSVSHLIDPPFGASLSKEDERLRDQLSSFLNNTRKIRHPAVSTLLRQLRARLGWKQA